MGTITILNEKRKLRGIIFIFDGVSPIINDMYLILLQNLYESLSQVPDWGSG